MNDLSFVLREGSRDDRVHVPFQFAFTSSLCCSRESELLLLDLQDFLAGTEGWLAFDVAAASNHWLLNRKYNLALRLYVETDDGKAPCAIFSFPCFLRALFGDKAISYKMQGIRAKRPVECDSTINSFDGTLNSCNCSRGPQDGARGRHGTC